MGNQFEINVRVGINEPEDPSRLDHSIDYGRLANLIRAQFERPRQLLEELLHDIEQDILREFPQTRSCSLSIRKMNPPAGIQAACSEVSIEKNYRET